MDQLSSTSQTVAPTHSRKLGEVKLKKLLGYIRAAEGPWVARYVKARLKPRGTSERMLDRLVYRARDEQGRRAAKLSISASTIRLGYKQTGD